MLQGIAPRAAKELALKVQSRAEAAAKMGDVPEAAQAAIHNQTIYLFSEALDAYAKAGNERTEGVRRLLHEVGHAWWDTLPEPEKAQLTELWQQETSGKTGPLYENGQLRPEVMAGTESDPQEWFAERTAMANDAWAQKRAAIADHDGSLLGRISARLRGWLFDAMQTLKPKWSQDAMTQKFRDAMRRGGDFGGASDGLVRFAEAKPGMKLEEVGNDFPVDDVFARKLSAGSGIEARVSAAATEFKNWPDSVKAADGSDILIKSPEQGKISARVRHLIFDHREGRIDEEKFAWLPNVADTLKNAAVRLHDGTTGNFVYVRAYKGGVKHMVVVSPEGKVEAQKAFTGSLVTQFPKGSKNQQSMKIDWVRPRPEQMPPASSPPPTGTRAAAESQ